VSNLELLRYSYEDYCLWEGDWELIEGIAVSMAPAPMRVHQNIATEIIFNLKNNFNEEECLECEISYENDWKLSNDTVVRPDIVVVCNEEHEKYLTKAPKVIIEVLSPSTAKKDETIKFNIYEAQKVTYYILVYPDDLVAKVYKIDQNRYTKIGDFSNETLNFEDIECKLSLDFAQVFKRFRR